MAVGDLAGAGPGARRPIAGEAGHDWPPAILKPESRGGDGDDTFEDYRFRYESNPPPPPELWNVEDATRLELARCRAFVRVLEVDPKLGRFRLRMKCLWLFRTLNSKEEAEIGLRGVPGVRMPGVIETVEESRIWKDLSLEEKSPSTTGKTLLWRGVSLITLDGFKAFDMLDVPYDRHILNLERIEFVWRSDKDAADYHKSMKLCLFEVHTSSMLPEWKPRSAYIRPLNESPENQRRSADGVSAPTYASKFTVHLRLERKHKFYVWQVFLVAYLITMLSCTPLAMPPDPGDLPDRLAMYSGGMLTLVAFKYGVSDRLPCVPYQTFTDQFLLAAILTIFGCALATLYPYRLADDSEYKLWIVDTMEHTLSAVVAGCWTAALLWAAFLKPLKRESWQDVLMRDRRRENKDPFGEEEIIDFDAEGFASEARPSICSNATAQIAKNLRKGLTWRSRASLEATAPSGPVERWTLRQVAEFITSLGLGHCLHLFKENAVDGRVLAELSAEDLQRELGLSSFQSKKVMIHLRLHREAG